MSRAEAPSHLNLVIPMAGRGTRFRDAGYETFKPFIPVLGKPMIQHVVDAFPSTVRRIIITSEDLLTAEQIRFLQGELGCSLVFIPAHSNGPAYSIHAARQSLPLDESFFVSYCDIFWEWDFDAIVEELDYSGVIYTHQGFHPHLINDNYSAFCRPDPQHPSLLSEIREKGSFTADWMSEPVSIGAFFVRSGHELVRAAGELITNDTRVSGEFFPSMIFNDLVARGGSVRLMPVEFYVHWGVPAQLQDVERWCAIVTAAPRPRPEDRGVESADLPENVVCMAGLGARMQRVSPKPKALVPVDGVPMYQYVAASFPARSTAVITVGEIAATLDRQGFVGEIVALPHQTASQYETLVLAAPALRNRKNFFLTSCDAYGGFDMAAFLHAVRTRRPAGAVFGFRPSLTQSKLAGHHTHMTVENDRVTAIHLKSRSRDDDLGLAGFFWLADGALFDRIADVPPWGGGEMIVDNVFKYFVDSGLDIMPFPLEYYVHLGTPDEYLEHKFWLDRRHLLAAS